MLQDTCLLQLPYKKTLRKLQVSYLLNQLELPQKEQICHSMNGNTDIFKMLVVAIISGQGGLRILTG